MSTAVKTSGWIWGHRKNVDICKLQWPAVYREWSYMRHLWFHAILISSKRWNQSIICHTHLFFKKVKWEKKCTRHLNKFILLFYCCHFLFHDSCILIIFWDEDKHHPSSKAHHPEFHPKLLFSQIVLEQWSCIKKSFWGWFKPIYKDNRRLSSDQLWLFGILHPELNKQVKNKDHVCPLPLSEGMSFEVTWQSGTRCGNI